MTWAAKLSKLLELGKTYDQTHIAWGEHVDNCPDCRRSPFACSIGLGLHNAWNDAWCAVRRIYITLSQTEKDEFFERAKEQI